MTEEEKFNLKNPLLSNYHITKSGRLFNKKTGHELAQSKSGNYLKFSMVNDEHKNVSKFIHQLVAETFLENFEPDKTIDHIDRNPLNNHIDNLRCATMTEQAQNKNPIISKRSSREVWKVDLNTGVKIELYNTLKAAANYIYKSGISKSKTSEENAINSIISNISKAAQGKMKNAYGFKWEYKTDENIYDDEEWRALPAEFTDNKPNYQISNYGRIKNKTSKISEGWTNSFDYKSVKFSKDNAQIHILVASVFLEKPEGKDFVNHKDGNKNNAHVSNLEWVTRKENQRHAIENGLLSRVKPIIQYTIKWERLQIFKSCEHAARALNIDRRRINGCCLNQHKLTDGFRFQFFRQKDLDSVKDRYDEKYGYSNDAKPDNFLEGDNLKNADPIEYQKLEDSLKFNDEDIKIAQEEIAELNINDDNNINEDNNDNDDNDD